MPLHATVIVIVATKENFNSLIQGLTKYQIMENDFKIICWKYFYLFNQPYTEFSDGDIVMFMSKFIVENLEQHFAVSHICVIVLKDPDLELTDFDFIFTNLNVIKDMQRGTSSVASNNYSDIDLITEDIESTTSRVQKRFCVMISRSSKQTTSSPPIINKFTTSFLTSVASVNTVPETVQIQKGNKKLSDLALSCFELTIIDDAQNEDVYAEDVLGDNNLEILHKQDVEKHKKKRNRRTPKKTKK
ncbi:7055_t:CDS:2 [Scutellospora calospora]|uniref:7055_t:CDS:1 n=1 Tax=Scutellospora calospora TaxID=85575 RepID=A0ACA9KF00_9GLOM|nr:7055_t:CDS:2 [Scutellospora calospora]